MPLIRTLENRFLRQIIFASCLFGLVLFVGGCGKAGGGSIQLKSPATGDKDIPAKSGYAFSVTKTFTDTANQITTAPSYRVYAANYDLDGGNFALTLDKPLTSDDQVRVVFSLVGDQGGNEKRMGHGVCRRSCVEGERDLPKRKDIGQHHEQQDRNMREKIRSH